MWFCKNNMYLIRGILMFLLCIINLYVMEWKPVNIIFGVLPFFLIGIVQIYYYVKEKITGRKK